MRNLNALSVCMASLTGWGPKLLQWYFRIKNMEMGFESALIA